MIIESMYGDREVTISTTKDATPGRISVLNRTSGKYEFAFLAPQGAYELIEALKDFAEKPKTAQEQFKELEIGTHFNLSEDVAERVKISNNFYAILGDPIVLLGGDLPREASITKVEK